MTSDVPPSSGTSPRPASRRRPSPRLLAAVRVRAVGVPVGPEDEAAEGRALEEVPDAPPEDGEGDVQAEEEGELDLGVAPACSLFSPHQKEHSDVSAGDARSERRTGHGRRRAGSAAAGGAVIGGHHAGAPVADPGGVERGGGDGRATAGELRPRPGVSRVGDADQRKPTFEERARAPDGGGPNVTGVTARRGFFFGVVNRAVERDPPPRTATRGGGRGRPGPPASAPGRRPRTGVRVVPERGRVRFRGTAPSVRPSPWALLAAPFPGAFPSRPR
ncbi:hypothetical protein THAOC_14033, partial [Thalassiosira oceanica]